MDWNYGETGKNIVLDKKPTGLKKMTGTRLGAILGMNEWKTPFQAWCEITKLANPEFEGNKYTEAGKAIEPKLIDYIRDLYYDVEPENLKDPEQYFGNNYAEAMKYRDFYSAHKHLGGMWDAVGLDDNGHIDLIVECKTSSRPQDWINGVPMHYLLQGLLYAFLSDATTLVFPVAFLKDEDYAHPENFVCTEDNTKLFWIHDVESYKIPFNDKLCTIAELVAIAGWWFEEYVKAGISPEFDEKKDKEYLDIIRMSHPEKDNDLDGLIALYKETAAEVDAETIAKVDAHEKQLKNIRDQIKALLIGKMSATDEVIALDMFKVSKSYKEDVDKEAMKRDGVLNKYLIKKPSYTITNKKEKE